MIRTISSGMHCLSYCLNVLFIDSDINGFRLSLIEDRTVTCNNLINYIRCAKFIGSDSCRISAKLKDRKAVIELSDRSLGSI